MYKEKVQQKATHITASTYKNEFCSISTSNFHRDTPEI